MPEVLHTNSFFRLWSGALKLPHEHQFTDFIEGLGTGQLVGRQVLASPCHGEVQIGLRDRNGSLEVEIVRARNLPQKVYYKMPPGSLYLIFSRNQICIVLFLNSALCESLLTGWKNVSGKATHANHTANS